MTIIGKYNEKVRVIENDDRMVIVESVDGLIYELAVKYLKGDKKEIENELKITKRMDIQGCLRKNKK